MSSFLARLQARPLLADGAMGTMLYARGINVRQCLEMLVVEHPALVAAIHEEYSRAGADVISTHTFGANRMRLAYYGLEGRVREFNIAAVRLAQRVRKSTGLDFLIAGNVGPVGNRVDWGDALASKAVQVSFREQLGALAEEGVDLLLFETFSDVEELAVAVRVAKEVSELPIVASMSYGADALTLAGQSVDAVTTRLLVAGVDVIGTNCSVGPAQMTETLHRMQIVAPQTTFSATPNAGLPEAGEDDILHYPVGADEFAGYVPRFLDLGARMVGGCCGTTPEHVRVMRRAMDAYQKK